MPRLVPWRGLGVLSLIVGALSVSVFQSQRLPLTAQVSGGVDLAAFEAKCREYNYDFYVVEGCKDGESGNGVSADVKGWRNTDKVYALCHAVVCSESSDQNFKDPICSDGDDTYYTLVSTWVTGRSGRYEDTPGITDLQGYCSTLGGSYGYVGTGDAPAPIYYHTDNFHGRYSGANQGFITAGYRPGYSYGCQVTADYDSSGTYNPKAASCGAGAGDSGGDDGGSSGGDTGGVCTDVGGSCADSPTCCEGLVCNSGTQLCESGSSCLEDEASLCTSGPGCNLSTCECKEDFYATGEQTCTLDPQDCYQAIVDGSCPDGWEIVNERCAAPEGTECLEACEPDEISQCNGQNSCVCVASNSCTDTDDCRRGTGCDTGTCTCIGGYFSAGDGTCEKLCGNGSRDEDDGEECDGVEGCTDSCTCGDGYAASEFLDVETGGLQNVCAPVCGDGKILGAEECDDGNEDFGDGCDDFCEEEDGWECTGEPSTCTNVSDQCPGDLNKTEPGQCGCNNADTDSDFDGTADCNDQCSNDPDKTEPGECGCGKEDKDRDGRPGIDCPTEGSLCGNEFVDEDEGETCDFINGRSSYSGDRATWGTCREINIPGECTYCGDGVVSTATDDDGNRIETCDEGLENDNNGTCRPNCTFCGDGIKNKNFVWDDQGNYTLVDEECDDGNRNNDDNCDNTCRDRTPPPCPPAGQTCCETFDDNNDGEIDDPSELQVTRGSGEACGKKLCVWCDARPDKPGRESCNVGFTSECAQCDPPADAGPDWEPDPGCICSTPSTICNARECSTPYEGNCRDFKQCDRADKVDCWVRRNGKRYERGYITVNLKCTEPVGGGAADATCRSIRPGGVAGGAEGGASGGAPPPTQNPGGISGNIGGVGPPVFPNQPLNPAAPNQPSPSTPIVPGPSSRSSQISTGLICPADVKICPDGSEVGRVGPDCEFPACPPVTSSRSSAISFSFSQQSSQCPDDVKICPDGRELKRGPTCQFPDCPSHLECQDQACAVVPGPGPNTCSTDDDCKDNKFLTCIANACTEIIGRQANDCSSDDDCAVPQRLECVGQTCTLVPGAGANRCEDNADCESPMRLACEDKQCVMVFGAGANECDNDQDCEDDQFFGCENNACTLLPGSRQEQCSTDFECQPASSAPSSIVLSSGASEVSEESSQASNPPSSSIAASAVTSPPRSSTSQTSQSSQQASLPDEIPPNCGDGNIDPGEECDDGLLNSNRRRNRCRLDCRLFFCGDGIVDSQNNETCDDANPFDNDGCSSECRTEIPASSEPSSISASSTTSTLIAQSSESEDSSRRNQRRSSRPRLITVNPDEDDDDTTTESSSSRRMVAAAPICGNGTLDQNEECDDSNRRDNDGCSSECQLEIGICGDGIIQRLLGEQCEQVSHDPALPYFCEQCRFVSPSCGDGILDPGEECDEGSQNSNQPNGNCRLSCYFGGCGDGIQDQNEQCDDGNGVNGDGCSRRCRIEQAKSSSSASSTSSQTPQQRITAVANELIRQGVAPQMAMMMAQMQVQSEQQRINFPFPTTPTGQPLPAQLPLAQLQPLIQTQAPVGDTGPAAVAVIGAGAAAGFSFMRRRK